MAEKSKLPSTAVGRRRLLRGAALLEADAKNKKGITLRNRFLLFLFGWGTFPAYVTADVRLWRRWIWQPPVPRKKS